MARENASNCSDYKEVQKHDRINELLQVLQNVMSISIAKKVCFVKFAYCMCVYVWFGFGEMPALVMRT